MEAVSVLALRSLRTLRSLRCVRCMRCVGWKLGFWLVLIQQLRRGTDKPGACMAPRPIRDCVEFRVFGSVN